jgi:hypothetical protein
MPNNWKDIYFLERNVKTQEEEEKYQMYSTVFNAFHIKKMEFYFFIY